MTEEYFNNNTFRNVQSLSIQELDQIIPSRFIQNSFLNEMYTVEFVGHKMMYQDFGLSIKNTQTTQKIMALFQVIFSTSRLHIFPRRQELDV